MGKLIPLVLLCACSLNTGGYYTASGSHPHVTYYIRGELGPVEAFHTPLTQGNLVTDLVGAGITHGVNIGPLALVPSLGWSWARTWGACAPPSYEVCEHTWTDNYYASLGLSYSISHLVLDTRYVKAEPMNGLTFTIGGKL